MIQIEVITCIHVYLIMVHVTVLISLGHISAQRNIDIKVSQYKPSD